MPIKVTPFRAAIVIITAANALLWSTSAFEDEAKRSTQLTLQVIALPAPRFAEPLHKYIEVVNGCSAHYEGFCVDVRAGPGEEYRITGRLRMGVVLKVGATQTNESGTWYRIVYHEPIRYPERLARAQYVRAGGSVRYFFTDGTQDLARGSETSTKKMVVVDRSEQMLYAYDGDDLFLQTAISTGLDITPTPRGAFTVYRKTPTRYMQGPLPGISKQFYDLPGVPWNLYFTQDGGVIHGAYWHNSFGRKWSNGCVNVPLDKAEELYEWAELGMRVVVRD